VAGVSPAIAAGSPRDESVRRRTRLPLQVFRFRLRHGLGGSCAPRAKPQRLWFSVVAGVHATPKPSEGGSPATFGKAFDIPAGTAAATRIFYPRMHTRLRALRRGKRMDANDGDCESWPGSVIPGAQRSRRTACFGLGSSAKFRQNEPNFQNRNSVLVIRIIRRCSVFPRTSVCRFRRKARVYSK